MWPGRTCPLAVRAGLGVLLVVALAVCAEFGVCVTDPREWRYVLVSALGLVVVAGAWVTGWALREARDVDPTSLALLSMCLEDERGLRLISPSGDPLADSAPHGSFRTTIEGNDVTVSIWSDHEAATATLETYAAPDTREPRGARRRARPSSQSVGRTADGEPGSLRSTAASREPRGG